MHSARSSPHVLNLTSGTDSKVRSEGSRNGRDRGRGGASTSAPQMHVNSVYRPQKISDEAEKPFNAPSDEITPHNIHDNTMEMNVLFRPKSPRTHSTQGMASMHRDVAQGIESKQMQSSRLVPVSGIRCCSPLSSVQVPEISTASHVHSHTPSVARGVTSKGGSQLVKSTPFLSLGNVPNPSQKVARISPAEASGRSSRAPASQSAPSTVQGSTNASHLPLDSQITSKQVSAVSRSFTRVRLSGTAVESSTDPPYTSHGEWHGELSAVAAVPWHRFIQNQPVQGRVPQHTLREHTAQPVHGGLESTMDESMHEVRSMDELAPQTTYSLAQSSMLTELVASSFQKNVEGGSSEFQLVDASGAVNDVNRKWGDMHGRGCGLESGGEVCSHSTGTNLCITGIYSFSYMQ